MRRFHATLVALIVIALLATPLALLARSSPNDPTQCCGAYCPMRAHSSQHKMMCGSFSVAERNCGCAMRSNQQPDYGLNTLMAPTMTSASVRINAPESSRRTATLYAEYSLSASLSAPFHPPRN
jgi:hypothetical protein